MATGFLRVAAALLPARPRPSKCPQPAQPTPPVPLPRARALCHRRRSVESWHHNTTASHAQSSGLRAGARSRWHSHTRPRIPPRLSADPTAELRAAAVPATAVKGDSATAHVSHPIPTPSRSAPPHNRGPAPHPKPARTAVTAFPTAIHVGHLPKAAARAHSVPCRGARTVAGVKLPTDLVGVGCCTAR